MQNEKPPLTVSVFADYICPFCYIGSARLLRLREHYALDVDWCFVEIHPETPASGMPLEALGYPPQQWARMMRNLYDMASRDGILIAERQFTTNSRQALRLAEAAKDCGDEVFYALHEALFASFFGERENIGDPLILQRLAQEAGMPAASIERALIGNPELEARMLAHRRRATSLGIGGVPAFIIGDHLLSGCVDYPTLERAAQDSA